MLHQRFNTVVKMGSLQKPNEIHQVKSKFSIENTTQRKTMKFNLILINFVTLMTYFTTSLPIMGKRKLLINHPSDLRGVSLINENMSKSTFNLLYKDEFQLTHKLVKRTAISAGGEVKFNNNGFAAIIPVQEQPIRRRRKKCLKWVRIPIINRFKCKEFAKNLSHKENSEEMI